ncbi:MAG: glycosyltransferase family 2 protein [Actinobacteria bacterium]|jgi:glycosyltransferase involved in cell wall biosynthesis|nr:glycosyltransferase family 2 protein [Actinomycetota bacterium]
MVATPDSKSYLVVVITTALNTPLPAISLDNMEQHSIPDVKPSNVNDLVSGLALKDFYHRYPEVRMEPVVALVAAYEEVSNIGQVLDAIPVTACGFATTTLVVVDGGDDGTEDVVMKHPSHAQNMYCCVLPVNMGHGIALKIGYELALRHGARYVVTLDADGQNDPKEMEQLLEPVVSGEADLVVGSRRLGTDHTSDRMRKAGVLFFGKVISLLTKVNITDTSNGYRAFRAALLDDITLEQAQYQTAEVIIAAAMHGWRIQERPVTWHPRASGTTKKGHNVWFGFNYAMVTARTWLRERRNR